MSKGIVVMNKPDRCIECPMSYHADDLELCGCYKRLYRCRLEPEDVEEVYIDLHTKPDWCPIKPLPEKKDVREETTSIGGVFLQGKETGWNDFIDEILKGETIEENQPHQEQR